MTKTARPLSESNLGPYRRARAETLVNGKQDQRRMAGPELQWFQQALGHRDEFPVNVPLIGDSMTENFGVTDDYHSWAFLLTSAVQNRYRNGGFGYKPVKHAPGVTWPYTANPDGKNAWSQTTGADTDNVDYGFGFGRLDSFMANASAKSITIDCDRFWVMYTNFSGGVLTIDVDAGTPFALTTTQSTTAPTNAPGFSGRIFDSQVAWGTLNLGTHTVKVTATTSTPFLDGIMIFYTDGNAGIHVWNGGHSGYTAGAFDPANGAAGADWADMFHQPYTPTGFADGVGNGTTTFTSATAAFATLDEGQYILFAAGTQATNGMARIVTRVSATQVTLDRVVASGTGISFEMNRAQVTDGSFTAGSTTLTSATAAFNPWDVGLYVSSAGNVATGTYIARYISATQVTLSTTAASTVGSQTVRFMGRQKYWCAADLMTIEFGINDLAGGITTTAFKQNLRNIVSLVAERPGFGFPTGFPQRYTPSVVLLGMWATATAKDQIFADLSTTSGGNHIFSDYIDFDPSDVGKTITSPSNTPIPTATTISSVVSNREAVISNNAVATVTGTGSGTIVARAGLEKTWMKFRQALFELASENTWRFFDLYSLGGYIGTNDVLNLTYDLTHPNNHGAKWVGDELDILITGSPRSGPIPVGIMDNVGDLIVGLSADVAGKMPRGQLDGQILHASSVESSYGVSHGLIYSDPMMLNRVMFSYANVGAATFTDVGIAALTNTLTGGGTAATNDQASGAFVKMPTLTTSGNAMGRKTANFTSFDIRWLPEFACEIFTDTAITNVRHWYGFFSAAPEGSASPVASLAAFRYDTGAGDTAGKWTTCTKDGTTLTAKLGVATIAVSTRYVLRIEVVGVKGTSVSKIRFWINDVLVAEHTTNLPATGKTLGVQTSVTTLTAAAAAFNFGRLAVSH